MWTPRFKRQLRFYRTGLSLLVASFAMSLLSRPTFGNQSPRRNAIVKTGPCYANGRPAFLVRIMQQRNAQGVERLYSEGCQGYPEKALSALRLYELKAPSSENDLLNSMPRGLGDLMALTWMLTDGTAESVGDVTYFWQALPPYDELPSAPPDGAPAIARSYFRLYFSSLADCTLAHPEYLPRFMMISQLYGHKEDSYLIEYFRDNTGVNVEAFFSKLLWRLYRANPTVFEKYAQWTQLGNAALKEVLAYKHAGGAKDTFKR